MMKAPRIIEIVFITSQNQVKCLLTPLTLIYVLRFCFRIAFKAYVVDLINYMTK